MIDIIKNKGGFVSMCSIFSRITKKMTTYPGVIEEELKKFISSLSIALPEDFITFLEFTNGAEGEIGSNYLVIWGTTELGKYNNAYSVEKYAPGLFLFGSDGGGTGYGFDLRKDEIIIVEIPFIGMNWRIANKVGNNFVDFLYSISGIEQ